MLQNSVTLLPQPLQYVQHSKKPPVKWQQHLLDNHRCSQKCPWKMIVGWPSTLFFLGSITTIYSLLVAYMAIGHIIEIKHYTNFQNELLKTYKLYWTFVVFVLLSCVYTCTGVQVTTAYVRSQDNSQKSILTCYPVGSCNWTQVVRPLVKHLLSNWHTGNNI